MLTQNEREYCVQIAGRIEKLRHFLNARFLASPEIPSEWYSFLAEFKTIQGNLNNDISFVATLLAKSHLQKLFQVSFDAAAKPQGAPGIDIDVQTNDGQRIVAEIKTTSPYQATDFGAQQAASFKKDFAKLAAAKAQHKFLFVTEQRAFEALRSPKYTCQISGVRVVLLPEGKERVA